MSDLQADIPDAKRPRTGDSDVDVHRLQASASSEQQTSQGAAPAQQAAAKDMFGSDLQGPAGVRTDFPPVGTQEEGMGDLEPGAMERPNGIIGPEGPLDRPDPNSTPEAQDAAENAAANAHNKSDDPDDVMDALEAAEAKYDKAHPDDQSIQDVENTKVDQASAESSNPGRPAHASKDIDQDIRDHATERMQTAFSKNAAVHKKDVQRLAKELEEACFGRAKTGGNSRGTYHNLVANGARLASTERDVDSIPRIAAGEPAEVANGTLTAGQEAGDVPAGLQGVVDKPRHAVG